MELKSIEQIIREYSSNLLKCCQNKENDFFGSGISDMREARNEIGYLLCHVLNKDKVFLLSHGNDVLTEPQMRNFLDCYGRRSKGEPLAYIMGRKEFFGYDFFVDGSTLIPRPDTEILAETCLGLLKEEEVSVLDLGTGSGCILLTLLKEKSTARGIGVDISPQAVALAEKNAENLGCGSRAEFLVGDFSDIGFAEKLRVFLKEKGFSEKFDCIVSNPPYIPLDEYEKLHPSVKNYEPRQALFSPQSSENSEGFFHIEAIIRIAAKMLKQGGLLLIEHGYNQGKTSRDLCSREEFAQIRTICDYAQNERVLAAVKK